MRLDVLLEVIEDRLPSFALHFGRILRLGVERLGHVRVAIVLLKCGAYFPVVIHREINLFLIDNLRVRAAEIKTEALVFRFHAIRERAALAQIVSAFRRVPIIRSMVPFHDVIGVRPALPDLLDRSVDHCFDGDSGAVGHRRGDRDKTYVASLYVRVEHCEALWYYGPS